MPRTGSALAILGAWLVAPLAYGSEATLCGFTASVVGVVKPFNPVELEGRKVLSTTLRIKVSKSSKMDGYTDCSEYAGAQIQVEMLTSSRQTANAVKKGSVVRVEYSRYSGLGDWGVEVFERWWLLEVLDP